MASSLGPCQPWACTACPQRSLAILQAVGVQLRFLSQLFSFTGSPAGLSAEIALAQDVMPGKLLLTVCDLHDLPGKGASGGVQGHVGLVQQHHRKACTPKGPVTGTVSL